MKLLLKKLFSKILKKPSGHLPVSNNCVRLTNKEVVFLHYALSLVKRNSIDHLNAVSEFKTIKYLVEDYCWSMIQDSDKLLNVLDGQIRKRKLHKTYLEYKIESQLHFKENKTSEKNNGSNNHSEL